MITPDWKAIARYQNTAYWTSIDPNRLTVWPVRNTATYRRQRGFGERSSIIGRAT